MSLELSLSKEQIENEQKRFQPMQQGWYPGKVLSCVAELSKKKDSTNFVTVFDMGAKQIRHYFNTKNQFGIVKFFAAISNKTVQEALAGVEGGEIKLDFSITIGKTVMCKVINALATDGSGKIFDNIDDFAAEGKIPF